MDDIVIIGVGMTPWSKYPNRTVADLGVEAALVALKDAGLEWRQIQGMAASVHAWGGMDGLVAGNVIASAMGGTGIPVQNIFNACAVGGSTLRSASSMIHSGECEITMAIGSDISPEGFLPSLSDDPKETDSLRWRMAGVSNPGFWGLECCKRMQEFGTTEEILAMTKVVTSKYGKLNPLARYKKEYTLEEVLASPMVASPLRLYEICATSDGAAAVILASMKTARKLGISKPIRLAGVSLASMTYGDPTIKVPLLSDPVNDEVPTLSDAVTAANRAYEMAGVGPEDVDFVEVPDNSAWHYLIYLEKMGFFKPGEADRALMEGETQLGGKLPVCPSGGASSFGEAVGAQGLAQACELVDQLRGNCGPRQVENAKVGMAQVYGLQGNSASVILTV